MEFSMKDFWNGSRRALARAITIVEDERDGFEDIMKEIYHHTGRAQVIGITVRLVRVRAHCQMPSLSSSVSRAKL